jgi:hypothetical protein
MTTSGKSKHSEAMDGRWRAQLMNSEWLPNFWLDSIFEILSRSAACEQVLPDAMLHGRVTARGLKLPRLLPKNSPWQGGAKQDRDAALLRQPC